MSRPSPTARTIKMLREAGHLADNVERRIPHTNITKDLFGFMDVIAIEGASVVGIQCTTMSHHANRREKAKALPALRRWLATGAKFEVWSWRPRTEYYKDGVQKHNARIEQLYLDKSDRLRSFGITTVFSPLPEKKKSWRTAL